MFLGSKFPQNLSCKFPILSNPFKVVFIIFNSEFLVVCSIRLLRKTYPPLLDEEIITKKSLLNKKKDVTALLMPHKRFVKLKSTQIRAFRRWHSDSVLTAFIQQAYIYSILS